MLTCSWPVSGLNGHMAPVCGLAMACQGPVWLVRGLSVVCPWPVRGLRGLSSLSVACQQPVNDFSGACGLSVAFQWPVKPVHGLSMICHWPVSDLPVAKTSCYLVFLRPFPTKTSSCLVFLRPFPSKASYFHVFWASGSSPAALKPRVLSCF